MADTDSKTDRCRIKINVEAVNDPTCTEQDLANLDENVRQILAGALAFTSQHMPQAHRHGVIPDSVDESMVKQLAGWVLNMTDEEMYGPKEPESPLDDPMLKELLDQLGLKASKLAGIAVIHVVGPIRRDKHGHAKTEAPDHGDHVGHGSSPQDGDAPGSDQERGAEDLRWPDPAGEVSREGMDEGGDVADSAAAVSE